ncbi:MAG: hypothetical protein M0D57_10595 [Sphingobacteriales bacterium JAD_PAG50586_3]|nr:MAG: hypothetical protein M0D57_10595 [Sphingobacteriales bacterium JAD_PAG50586_3]
MILKDKHGVAIPSIAYAMNAISHGRTLQLNSDAKRLSEIKGSSKETLHEFVILATEVAALTVQLSTTQLASGVKNDMKEVGEVPLIGFSSTLDYAEETPTDLRKRSGLSGILSSKNLINLPVLIDRAVSRIWFAGYSQRLLFTIPEIRVALLNAAKRNVDIRILMVDPDSLAGQARSLSQAYASPDDFFNDVRLTVQQFALFKEELEKDKPMNPVTCDLRLSKCMLSASYFFVDDTCICSLYSSNLTGGVGGAFVFNSSSVQSNGYYQVLLREFQSDWGTDKE